MAAFSIETVAATAILPYLRTLGDRWRDGDASVAQEHFATGLLRARLLGLARGWDRGAGPRALLACPSGEHHDLGLIILGLALRDRGWRVTFLGPDTPIETLAAAADQLAPDAVVLSSLAREPLAAAEAEIARMASSRPVLLAGPGADADWPSARGPGCSPAARSRPPPRCPPSAAGQASHCPGLSASGRFDTPLQLRENAGDPRTKTANACPGRNGGKTAVSSSQGTPALDPDSPLPRRRWWGSVA